MASALPAPKSDFVGIDDGAVHLGTGGQSPMLVRHRTAFEQFMADKASGEPGYVAHAKVGQETRALMSRLTHLPAANHAFLGNASEGIGRVISSMTWQAGDNVVVSAKDYASGLAAWFTWLSLVSRLASCRATAGRSTPRAFSTPAMGAQGCFI